MKCCILSLLLCINIGIQCFSQSFRLSDDNISISNGTDLFLSGPSDTLQLITWLSISNLTTDSIKVMMKKEEIYMPPEASSSICWAGYCFDPKIMVSVFPLTIPRGETVSGCFGHFAPNGGRGVSVIRWTFFNSLDPDDSTSVISHYSTYPAAIEDKTNVPRLLGFDGPNPANGQIVLNHEVPPGKLAHIELRNLAGKVVASTGTISFSGTVVINTRELTAGIYVCSLVIDGKYVENLKVIINH